MSGAFAAAILVALERRVGRRRRRVLLAVDDVVVDFRLLFIFLVFVVVVIVVTNFADVLSDGVSADGHFAVVVVIVVVTVVVIDVDVFAVVIDVVSRLGRMDEFSVTSKRLRVDEGFGAVLAGVRPLARVAQPVPLEAGGVLVGLAAVAAVIGPEVNQ